MFPEAIKSVAGYKEVPIHDNNEPLVPLGPFSEYRDIYTDAIYAGERISSPHMHNQVEGSLIAMFVRRGVAERLRLVQESLQFSIRNSYLVVYDAYRTPQAQQALFDRYYSALAEKRPDLSNEERLAWTTKYVSEPSTDPAKPSTHSTGGSVDLGICMLPDKQAERLYEIDEKTNWNGLDWKKRYRLEVERASIMSSYGKSYRINTQFDHGQQEASHTYLRNLRSQRRLTREENSAMTTIEVLLRHMSYEEFEPLESEWWHYNSRKTQMGAKSSELPFAEYGYINLSVENLRHEQMRRDHLIAMKHLREWWRPVPTDPKYEYYELIREVNQEMPHWEYTSLPKAEILLP